MASTGEIEGGNAKRSRNTSSRERRRLQERGRPRRDRKPFPFLSLPGEIRNEIYWEVLGWDVDRRGSRLGDQPAITRVNRQVRTEALRIYYNYSAFEVRTSNSEEWVPFVQRVLYAFNGGPRGLPGGSESTLQLLGALQVDFLTDDGEPQVRIEVELEHSPENAMEIDPEYDCEAVVVGSPDLDWTDAAAAQAACDEAARKLANDITRRTTPVDDEEDLELFAASTPADHRAALDATRLLALACPFLRPSVCICDASEVESYEAGDGGWTDGDFSDGDPDRYGYDPDTPAGWMYF
ncbi:hypothetical protein KVR01_013624 [Diaporthe batatas]|uniref:uncharacterized protein n=1 Tax=Diaporthe batatas TaxID=748121 RepID=UPI001D0507B4|nr:uncharacterized protein KVR01_013624 [Diaporthe batatas]KAG8156520.1 hypothetical protein KVR01_013624 [Diaporthe batatas]